jgi:hypothetical protein
VTAHLAYDLEQTAAIASGLGVEFADVTFDLEEFQLGLDMELADLSRDPEANPVWVDPMVVARLAIEHLGERSDYYSRLARMHDDALGD